MASPTYSPAVYEPVAAPRSLVGNHLLTRVLLAGKAGVSAAPRASRSPSREPNPRARLMHPVTIDQKSRATPKVFRGPTRSSIHPPGICRAAEGHENAEKITPIWTSLMCGSGLTIGAALERFARSR